MKKILIILFTFSAFFSCDEDFLTNPPEGEIPGENFLTTPEDALLAINSCYAHLRSWENSAFPSQFVFGVPADDVVKGSNPGDASFITAYDEFSYTANDGGASGYWNGQWAAVNRTNQVITKVPLIDMDESLKQRYVAEAKFIRAYYYFNLVRIFGGIPIFDGLQDNYNIPRNTKEEVYQFIISDFSEAAATLPDSYAQDIGRATRGAALGFLAKVSLYNGDFQGALNYSNQVMSMGYSLDPDFNHLFRPDGEFGPESVFEVDCFCTPEFGGSQYAEVQGARGQYGWGFFGPSQTLIDAFDENDIRKELTILRNGETTPEGDLIAMTDENSYDKFNQKAYVPSNLQINGCASGSVQNIRILRFADILLINAEAALQTGNSAQAASSLNLVRQRAGLDPINSPTMQNIWDERRFELAMEGDRFVDLVRTGQAATVLSSFGFTPGKNEIFPIPQIAIDQSNGVLEQNPGY